MWTSHLPARPNPVDYDDDSDEDDDPHRAPANFTGVFLGYGGHPAYDDDDDEETDDDEPPPHHPTVLSAFTSRGRRAPRRRRQSSVGAMHRGGSAAYNEDSSDDDDVPAAANTAKRAMRPADREAAREREQMLAMAPSNAELTASYSDGKGRLDSIGRTRAETTDDSVPDSQVCSRAPARRKRSRRRAWADGVPAATACSMTV